MAKQDSQANIGKNLFPRVADESGTSPFPGIGEPSLGRDDPPFQALQCSEVTVSEEQLLSASDQSVSCEEQQVQTEVVAIPLESRLSNVTSSRLPPDQDSTASQSPSMKNGQEERLKGTHPEDLGAGHQGSSAAEQKIDRLHELYAVICANLGIAPPPAITNALAAVKAIPLEMLSSASTPPTVFPPGTAQLVTLPLAQVSDAVLFSLTEFFKEYQKFIHKVEDALLLVDTTSEGGPPAGSGAAILHVLRAIGAHLQAVELSSMALGRDTFRDLFHNGLMAQSLGLASCKVRKLDLFGPFPFLKSIVLDHNPGITHLPEGCFGGAPMLASVSLCATGITNPWAATAALAVLPQLEELRFQRCGCCPDSTAHCTLFASQLDLIPAAAATSDAHGTCREEAAQDPSLDTGAFSSMVLDLLLGDGSLYQHAAEELQVLQAGAVSTGLRTWVSALESRQSMRHWAQAPTAGGQEDSPYQASAEGESVSSLAPEDVTHNVTTGEQLQTVGIQGLRATHQEIEDVRQDEEGFEEQAEEMDGDGIVEDEVVVGADKESGDEDDGNHFEVQEQFLIDGATTVDVEIFSDTDLIDIVLTDLRDLRDELDVQMEERWELAAAGETQPSNSGAGGCFGGSPVDHQAQTNVGDCKMLENTTFIVDSNEDDAAGLVFKDSRVESFESRESLPEHRAQSHLQAGNDLVTAARLQPDLSLLRRRFEFETDPGAVGASHYPRFDSRPRGNIDLIQSNFGSTTRIASDLSTTLSDRGDEDKVKDSSPISSSSLSGSDLEFQSLVLQVSRSSTVTISESGTSVTSLSSHTNSSRNGGSVPASATPSVECLKTPVVTSRGSSACSLARPSARYPETPGLVANSQEGGVPARESEVSAASLSHSIDGSPAGSTAANEAHMISSPVVPSSAGSAGTNWAHLLPSNLDSPLNRSMYPLQPVLLPTLELSPARGSNRHVAAATSADNATPVDVELHQGSVCADGGARSSTPCDGERRTAFWRQSQFCHASPICLQPHYREFMLMHLPRLAVLDNMAVTAAENDNARHVFCKHFEPVAYGLPRAENILTLLQRRETQVCSGLSARHFACLQEKGQRRRQYHSSSVAVRHKVSGAPLSISMTVGQRQPIDSSLLEKQTQLMSMEQDALPVSVVCGSSVPEPAASAAVCMGETWCTEPHRGGRSMVGFRRALGASLVQSCSWQSCQAMFCSPEGRLQGDAGAGGNGEDMRRYWPRQFEYHPSDPHLMVFGTLHGEVVVVNHEAEKIVGQVHSIGAPHSILGLCWLNKDPSKLIGGCDNGSIQLYDINCMRACYVASLRQAQFPQNILRTWAGETHTGTGFSSHGPRTQEDIQRFPITGAVRQHDPAGAFHIPMAGTGTTVYSWGTVRSPAIYTYEDFQQLTSVHVNCTDDVFVASGYSSNVGLYDLRTGTRLHVFPNLHQEHINVLKFSHHSPHIFATSSFDRDMKLWDTRQRIHVDGQNPIYAVRSKRGNVMVCFSPDDCYLLASAIDNEVNQYVASDGRLHMTCDIAPVGSQQNYTRSYYMNGRDYIVSGSCEENVVRICCARTGRRLRDVVIEERCGRGSLYVQSLRGDPFRDFHLCALVAYSHPISHSEIVKVNLVANNPTKAGLMFDQDLGLTGVGA